MNLDRLLNSLIQVADHGGEMLKRHEGDDREEYMRETAAQCLEIVQRCPKFRIYEFDELADRANLDDVPDSESTETASMLPFSAFSVVMPDTVLFFQAIGFPDNTDTKSVWVFNQCVDRPKENAFDLTLPIVCLFTKNGDVAIGDHKTMEPPDDEEEKKEMYRSAGFAFATLLILSMYSKHVELVTPNDKQQKKRAKSGKYPLFEYRIITLDSIAVNQLPAKQRAGILKRLSPRTHVRRGHWAQMHGKRTFRRSCIVNAKVQHTLGRIAKDYDLQP